MTNKEIIGSLITLDEAINYCYTTIGEDSRLAEKLGLVRMLISNQLEDGES